MPAVSIDIVLNRDGTRLAVVALRDNDGRQDVSRNRHRQWAARIALADAPSQTAAAREWLLVLAAFSVDGSLFLAAGESADGPRVKVWSTANGKDISTIRVSRAVHAAGLTADGKSLVLALDDHVLHVVDRATGEEQTAAGRPFRCHH